MYRYCSYICILGIGFDYLKSFFGGLNSELRSIINKTIKISQDYRFQNFNLRLLPEVKKSLTLKMTLVPKKVGILWGLFYDPQGHLNNY